MKYKLVIFDLDNTLIKTRPAAKFGYRQAINFIAKQHGLEHSRDKLYNHWKRLVNTLIGEHKPHLRRFAYSLKQLLLAHKLPDTHFVNALNLYEKELITSLEPVNGAKELLQTLKNAGVKLAVATGSDRSEAIKKLKATGLWTFIDLLVTSTDIDSMKPDILYYSTILKNLKIKADKAVVVGDNQADDLDPAKTLGVNVLKVLPNTPNLLTIKANLLE